MKSKRWKIDLNHLETEYFDVFIAVESGLNKVFLTFFMISLWILPNTFRLFDNTQFSDSCIKMLHKVIGFLLSWSRCINLISFHTIPTIFFSLNWSPILLNNFWNDSLLVHIQFLSSEFVISVCILVFLQHRSRAPPFCKILLHNSGLATIPEKIYDNPDAWDKIILRKLWSRDWIPESKNSVAQNIFRIFSVAPHMLNSNFFSCFLCAAVMIFVSAQYFIFRRKIIHSTFRFFILQICQLHYEATVHPRKF